MAFKINRAPVLMLWAAVVAERLSFDHDEALTYGGPWPASLLTRNAIRGPIALAL